ncbi:MAG: UDP-N-acetylmuramoyl-L-alanine--D-glutamate ligase, partial [Geminicoccaceae bacterium]
PFLDRVRHAYLIGEAAARFAEALAGRVPCSRCGDLATAFDQATEAARRDAANDPVVLLTPACASFDQFTDFEARGEAFKALVGGLGEPLRAAAGGRR